MTHKTDNIAHKKAAFEERIIFFFVAMGVIALTYGFFYLIDFLPETPAISPTATTTVEVHERTSTPSEEISALPVRIRFDTLGREVAVLNPIDRSIAALDAALLSGVVRHPDSADFKTTGTIFLFGHSSYLPTVKNKNFQAFNGIQKLVWGDTIRLYSDDTEYIYQVDRVYEVSAEQANVTLERGMAKLTLVTCDSFGAKSDRFIVEATLVSKRGLNTATS